MTDPLRRSDPNPKGPNRAGGPAALQAALPGISDRHAAAEIAYYRASELLEKALRERDYERAALQVRKNLALIPRWLRELRRDRVYRTVIHSVPELERGGIVLALVGDAKGIARMRRLVTSEPELAPWAERVERHDLACRLVPEIENLVRTRPGCLQREMKRRLGAEDGRLVVLLIEYLERAGRITRVRAHRTWRLFPPDSPLPEAS